MTRMASILLACLLLAGCATNPWSSTFTGHRGRFPKTTSVQAIRRADADQVWRWHEEPILQSTAYVGKSDFLHTSASEPQLIAFAKSVGADLIIYSVEYRGSETEQHVGSYMLPTTTHHSGSVWTGGTSAWYSGTSQGWTSQMYSYKTTNHWYRGAAVYLRRDLPKTPAGTPSKEPYSSRSSESFIDEFDKRHGLDDNQ